MKRWGWGGGGKRGESGRVKLPSELGSTSSDQGYNIPVYRLQYTRWEQRVDQKLLLSEESSEFFFS